MKKRKPTLKEIVTIYQKKGCNITSSCEALGIDRKTFYNWRNKNAKLDEALKDAEDSILDFAESKLIEHINDGDTTCLIFMLKTKGKNRGYVERHEQEIGGSDAFLEVMKEASKIRRQTNG
jgi:hypothetical protein